MSISSKLSSTLKGTAREASKGVIDADSMHIFDQEIHEFEKDITSSKNKLALNVSKVIQVEREISQANSVIEEKEKEVIKLLAGDKQQAAVNIAEEIAELETKVKQLNKNQRFMRTQEQTLKHSLKTMILNLDTFKSEYNLAEAKEKMYKAQSKLTHTDSNTNNCFADIQRSLARIQNRQQESSKQMEAMVEVETSFSSETENQLKESIISAQEVLQRIKDKTARICLTSSYNH